MTTCCLFLSHTNPHIPTKIAQMHVITIYENQCKNVELTNIHEYDIIDKIVEERRYSGYIKKGKGYLSKW